MKNTSIIFFTLLLGSSLFAQVNPGNPSDTISNNNGMGITR